MAYPFSHQTHGEIANNKNQRSTCDTRLSGWSTETLQSKSPVANHPDVSDWFQTKAKLYRDRQSNNTPDIFKFIPG